MVSLFKPSLNRDPFRKGTAVILPRVICSHYLQDAKAKYHCYAIALIPHLSLVCFSLNECLVKKYHLLIDVELPLASSMIWKLLP